MKVSFNRTIQNEIGQQRLKNYYSKYLSKRNALLKKGIFIEKLTKGQLEQSILATRNEFARKGRYASDMVNTIIDRERYVGGMSYTEARSFKKALKLGSKITELREIDRDVLIAQNRDALKQFWNTLRGNDEAVMAWNSLLGTNYSVRESYKVISNYFFGSK